MKFGIKKLDELIGGIETGRVVLIETVGGLGSELVYRFMENAIESGENVFAVVPKRMKKDLEKRLKNARIIVPNGEISMQELYTVSLAIKRMHEKVGCIEIFQPLLIIHGPEKIYQLFQDVGNAIREKDMLVLVTIDKKLVDERTLAMFEDEADYVIEVEEVMEGLKIRRGIRIKKSPGGIPTDFYELRINTDVHVGEKVD
ncbi:RAD55 family ATPase [Archaeoglobus veneficus]|uniref:KaiC-like domain-containing protein n=1 Tax=Archaeoglobus veneficus (strain DSM 11195 / SNP6) TaxID=693661 RepID=F2KSF5_ARCVS|nr:hypothetical protein [Archaeoglobus veneficus]AEA46924.1 hypothetical protein Arcve_0913 [Archaeoglobus veneficus SNP6]